MTVRDRALGRAKGPFAAVQYIRGDVVNFGGALYTAKDSFVATSTFDPTKWEEVIPAPSSAFVKATIGPGLPSLADRTNGDLHYDTQARKLYAHIGVAGGLLYADNFNRADGQLAVAPYGVGKWEGFGAIISGNRMRFSSGSSYFGYVAFDTGGYYNDLSANVHFTTAQDGSYGGEIEWGLESLGDQGMGNITAPYKLKMYLANGATTASFHVYGPNGKLKLDGTYVTGTAQQISDYVTGTIGGLSASRPLIVPVRFSLQVGGRLRAWINNTLVFDQVITEALAQNKGTHVMMTGSSYYWNGVFYDDFLAGSMGTLEWAESKIDAANITFSPVNGLSSTTVKDALAELDNEKAPLVHSHTGRVGSSPLNTLGAGLPSPAGRQNGDLHMDTSLGRAYMHTGAPAQGVNYFVDNFDRADSASLGTAPNGEAYTYPDNTWFISGGVAKPTNSQPSEFILNLKSANGIFRFLNGLTGSLRVHFRWSDVNNFWMWEYGQFYKKQAGSFFPIGAATAISAAALVGKVVEIEMVGTTFAVYIDGVLHQTVATGDSFNSTATRAGVRWNVTGASNTGLYVDAVSYDTARGTEKWEATEPIYLQAQLATGNVAVANHVLKPGLRVPVASTLKEIVLRCETAPVGSAITVAVERFNGGVSQGVIATASIPAGENVGSVVGLTQACAKGDIIKFNITSVGSTTAGADLTASLDLR